MVEKERFETLLEEIRDKVSAVAEGHDVIRREVREMKSELKSDIKEVSDKVEFVAKQLGSKIDKVGTKLDEHLRVPHAV